jgi:type I protein arginine methyltransferase
LTLLVRRSGVGHGLCHWFEATLVEGVGFSVGPGQPDNVYGRPFLPWPIPVVLAVGDEVHVEVRADKTGDAYVWTWRTRIVDGQGRPSTKASFEQSTFFSSPLPPRRLQHLRADHVPELNPNGRIDALILASMEERLPLGRIADEVQRRFPSQYTTRIRALGRVREMAAKYAD